MTTFEKDIFAIRIFVYSMFVGTIGYILLQINPMFGLGVITSGFMMFFFSSGFLILSSFQRKISRISVSDFFKYKS